MNVSIKRFLSIYTLSGHSSSGSSWFDKYFPKAATTTQIKCAEWKEKSLSLSPSVHFLLFYIAVITMYVTWSLWTLCIWFFFLFSICRLEMSYCIGLLDVMLFFIDLFIHSGNSGDLFEQFESDKVVILGSGHSSLHSICIINLYFSKLNAAAAAARAI